MFTGLISHLGRIRSHSSSKNGTIRLVVETNELARHINTGDSISVNGVCLTALDITEQSFAADLATETVACTTLAELTIGTAVNLELPMKAGSPLGGHIVQGHVDGVGTIISFDLVPNSDDWRLSISVPSELTRYIVDKGSITLDGISLTVAAIKGKHVNIAIIPHTYTSTNLHTRRNGDRMNVEVDVLAKYAEKHRETQITVEQFFSQGF